MIVSYLLLSTICKKKTILNYCGLKLEGGFILNVQKNVDELRRIFF